jgi:hypothetical protein
MDEIKAYRADTAEQFWDMLSPQKYLFGPQNQPIFRGQGDATWKLLPSILRGQIHPVYSAVVFRNDPLASESRIFAEIASLDTFVQYCDSTGLRTPFDSTEFRERYLLQGDRRFLDTFILGLKAWPSVDYYDLMALAQHHGLPTRLLDWSRRSYVAAYFAASDALSMDDAGELAVWALDLGPGHFGMQDLHVVRVPGSNNANLAAQAGLFTLLTQKYVRGAPFEGYECLCDYVRSVGSKALLKITLPHSEAPKVLDLCERYGITAATLFPDFNGAARATVEEQLRRAKSDWTDAHDRRAKTSPAFGET